MKKNSSFPILIFAAILAIGGATAYATYRVSPDFNGLWILGGAILLASFAFSAIQVVDQWSKAVVLWLGKFRILQGPRLFVIIPFIDTIPYWIDTRVLTSSFKAEKTLTQDTGLRMSCHRRGGHGSSSCFSTTARSPELARRPSDAIASFLSQCREYSFVPQTPGPGGLAQE
jgi:hypothetical protein